LEELTTVKLASRKRRFAAFAVDMILISTIGYLSSFLFENFYMKLGNYGKIIGAAAVLIYFGFFDSKIGKGQSIGKKLLKIKVVNKNSECISVLNGFIRSLWLFTVTLFNGFSLNNSKFIPIIIIIGTILFSIIFGEMYFFIFNKKTIQSLHDLYSNTFVVSTASEGEIEYKNSRKVLCCSTIIPLLILTLTICVSARTKNTFLGEYLRIIDLIQEDLPVHQTTISKNFSTVKNTSGTTRQNYVLLNTYKDNKSDDDKELAVRIAQKAFDNNFAINDDEILSIVISSGFNIGIASKNRNQRFNGTPAQWKYEIEKADNL
jgi:uncharacterized RDD family membrane protein YckC